jgi:hypothetical protein
VVKPLPSYPALPPAVAAELIRAAVDFSCAPKGPGQQNARRRFKRLIDRHGSDPLNRLQLWVAYVGTAGAVIRGDLELCGDRLAVTKQGQRVMRELIREVGR